MRIPSLSRLLSPCVCVLSLAVFPVELHAQAVSPAPEGAPLRPVVPVDAVQPEPPTYELALPWSEKTSALMTVPIRNESAKPMKVLGVQATGGIFIGDYPAELAPGKEDAIAFFYRGAADTDEKSAIIRLLTDQGVKVIRINLTREEVVRADTRELRWTVGDKPEEKIVTLTVSPGTVTPLKARASGGQAFLEPVDGTIWRLHVTPASTARSGQFAVFVDFSPSLPGNAVAILGLVQTRE